MTVSLLEDLANGNTRRIERIYQECFPRVRGYVVSNNGSKEDAEDIFQKALLQIAVRYQREPFEIKVDFEYYLYAVCKNLWLREINKLKKRVTNQEIGDIYSEDQDQAMALVEQEKYELFNEKLKQVSDNCQRILAMYFAKTSYAEIVKKENYNSETVARQRVFKCKKRLTDLVKADQRYFLLKSS